MTDSPQAVHRHFVAFPTFLAVLALTTVFSSGVQLPAALTGDGEQGVQVRFFSTGALGELSEGAEAHEDAATAILEKGSLLITHDGLLSVQAGNKTFYGLHGAFDVTRTQQDVTVAALTTPVLVSQGDMHMIVPVGMQWTATLEGTLAPLSSGPDAWSASRSVTLLPAHFVTEKLRRLSRFPKAVSALPPAQDVAAGQKPLLSEALLPEASAAVVREWKAKVIGAVRATIDRGDADGIRALLQDDALRDAFSGDEALPMLALLFGEAAGKNASVMMALFDTVSFDQKMWLLASFHPDFLSVAWLYERPELPREPKLVRLHLFVQALRTLNDVPGSALGKWEASWTQVLSAMEDPAIMVRFVASTVLDVLTPLEERGYPERALDTAHALVSLLSPYEEKVPDAAKALAAVRRFIDSRSTVTLPEDLSADLLDLQESRMRNAASSFSSISSVSSSSSSSVASSEFSSDEVISKAHLLLQSSEAVYSLETTIEALSPTEARITDIVFGSSQGDKTVSFTLNIADETVRNITIDGQTGFPYTPKFASFAGWVKQ
ncbi:hypothetical protein FJZ28_03050 [Candidatus Peregrinibacteria bacterium]|nr:hypothetical protein [Candidatus Peregrinibacteria bacterium]